ncbi:MAG: hypothetical protein K0T00_51 [Gaiellaceae bacterium]|jgi:hypothetical protein|nr:hypothetical protein [Gaiellaceae bacterium]
MKGVTLILLTGVLALAVAQLARADGSYSGSKAVTGTTSLTPTGHNPIKFADPTGDSAGGPDITAVTISNTAARVIRFEVAIANTAILADNQFVGIFIDVDDDTSNGPFGGFEYTIQAAGALGQAVLGRWDGSAYATTSAPSLVKTWVSGGTMTFQIAAADLGNATSLTFWAATEVLPDEGDWADIAPDGDATYTYTLSDPHAPTKPLTLVAGSATTLPARPVAGKALVVRMGVTRGDTGARLASGTVTCRVRLGSAPLRATGRIRRGVASCTMLIPKTAKGKLVRVTMKVTFQGVSTSKTVSRRVI